MSGLTARPVTGLAVLCLSVLTTACSRPPAADPMIEAMKPFPGNWKVVSLDRSGKKSSASALADMTLVVEGDKLTFEDRPAMSELVHGDVMTRDVRIEEYVIQVNPAKSGDIDLIYLLGAKLGNARLGLYAFEGDKLTICLAAVGEPRPEQIAPGSGLTVFVLQRQP